MAKVTSARIGLKDVHYAILIKDDSTGVTYNTPVKIAGAINARISPRTETTTLYADDGAFDTATTLGEITVELELADLPLEVQAALLGHTLQNGVLSKSKDDVAPYVALGFRALKSNGKYRYVWLVKGRFAENEEEARTKEDKVTFQTAKITGTFVCRNFDGKWELVGDEDITGFTPNTWFTTTTLNA